MRRHMKTGSTVKMLSTTALVAGVLMMSPAAHADPANSWDYDTVLDGNVSKDTSVAGVTDIIVNGGNGYVEGNADIYDGHTVNVTGDTGSTFAYHDNRDFVPSVIRGHLNSNMNIVIIDSDGMFFTETAEIDVQSLVATTGAIAVDDVMDGDGVLDIIDIHNNGASIVNDGLIEAQDAVLLHADDIENNGFILTQAGGKIILAAADQVSFSLDKSVHGGALKQDMFQLGKVGMVLNTGTVNAGEEGLAAIVAPFQENTGIITAKAGNVILAAHEEVTLDMYGDGLVEMVTDGELADALIHNKGTIEAAGGMINITAKAAKSTVDNLINNEGIITASSATVQGGKIILGGGDHGTVLNSGSIETNNDGDIDISGERFVQEDTPVPPSLPFVKSGGGNIKIAMSGDVVIDSGFIDGEGGNVEITNGATLTSKAQAIKTSDTGTIKLTQNEGGSIQNAIDAIANTGTGENTVNVDAGTYNEAVRADVENLNLKGANSGTKGDETRQEESIIIPNSPGVYITADNVTVDGFEIDGGTSGVRVNGADNAKIINNNIHDQYHPSGEGDNFGGFATGDGIFVRNSTGTLISGNKIADMNDDGIQARDVTDITITDNVINDSGNGDEGIGVAHASGITTIDGNEITGARRDGIQLDTIEGTADVMDNTVVGSNGAGVSVVDTDDATVTVEDNVIQSNGKGIAVEGDLNGGEINIVQNDIIANDTGVGINGDVNDATVNISDNRSILSLGDAILVESEFDEATIVVSDNENILSFFGDGIEVTDTGTLQNSDISIERNTISGAGNNGIRVTKTDGIVISENIISGTDDDGIDLNNVNGADVTFNTVLLAEDDGIDVDGGSNINIEENTVIDTEDDGISISQADNIIIFNNNIDGSTDEGVQIHDSSNVEILDNVIENSNEHGLHVLGLNNGYVQVQGNKFTDNGSVEFAQARFETGDIDMSDLSHPNTFTKTTGETGVAMQFEELDPSVSAGLRIVDETLGSTEFAGYTAADDFYVRFEDGSILDPVTNAPILIDGVNASFDATVPASFVNGILPVATLQLIEERLYDADDAVVNGRGQIFAGASEDATPEGPSNFEDFLPEADNSTALNNFASITILDLPSIGIDGGTSGLNNIEPAAGEEGEDESLANIEPAAGGDDGDNGALVTCLGDAVNSLGSNVVTYNFGGTFEQTIAGSSACQAGEL